MGVSECHYSPGRWLCSETSPPHQAGCSMPIVSTYLPPIATSSLRVNCLPPLMSPQQPSWKQEARQETAPEANQEPATKPAVEQKPDAPGENQRSEEHTS